jgi:hypothetical protein
MENRNIIRIINEEISNFDFLNNELNQKESEKIDILKNEEFQKQFICDSLLNKKDKIKLKINDSSIGGDYEEDFEDASRISLRYDLTVEYTYDQAKEPAVFDLIFYSDNIEIIKDGWYDRGRLGGTPDTDIEPSGDAWFSYINWYDIEVNMYTVDGDEIPFIAFQKAPSKIQMLFIRDYTANLIKSETNLSIETPEMEIKVNDVPYC